MTFQVSHHGGVVVVEAGRELSGRTGGELKRAMIELIEDGARKFVIDFQQTEFIDSAGLGALISVSKSVSVHEGTLRLMRLNGEMTRLFELTKLDTLFDIASGPAPQADDATIAGVTPPVERAERAKPAH